MIERDNVTAHASARSRSSAAPRIASRTKFGKPASSVFIRDEQCPVRFILLHVLTELRAKTCEPFIDVGEPRLSLLIEPRAAAHKTFPRFLQHAVCFGIETEQIALLVKRIDAGEEQWIHHDR